MFQLAAGPGAYCEGGTSPRCPLNASLRIPPSLMAVLKYSRGAMSRRAFPIAISSNSLRLHSYFTPKLLCVGPTNSGVTPLHEFRRAGSATSRRTSLLIFLPSLPAMAAAAEQAAAAALRAVLQRIKDAAERAGRIPSQVD